MICSKAFLKKQSEVLVISKNLFLKRVQLKKALCYGLDFEFHGKKNTEKYLIDLLKIVKLEELVDDVNNKLTNTFVSKLSGGNPETCLGKATLKNHNYFFDEKSKFNNNNSSKFASTFDLKITKLKTLIA